MFQSANTARAVAPLSRYSHLQPSYPTDDGTSPWVTLRLFNLTVIDHLKGINSLRKPAIKTFDPSASGKKMQMYSFHHRVGSCNFNQSRAEALPVACSRAAGEGTGKVKYPVLHALAGQEHMMSHCARANKARNHHSGSRSNFHCMSSQLYISCGDKYSYPWNG